MGGRYRARMLASERFQRASLRPAYAEPEDATDGPYLRWLRAALDRLGRERLHRGPFGLLVERPALEVDRLLEAKGVKPYGD